MNFQPLSPFMVEDDAQELYYRGWVSLYMCPFNWINENGGKNYAVVKGRFGSEMAFQVFQSCFFMWCVCVFVHSHVCECVCK